MMAKPEKRSFDNLINVTSDAFNASADAGEELASETPKMVNHRQSVYRVPLSMIRPDRFQARFLLPLSLREDFYTGRADWAETVRRWQDLAASNYLVQQELEELESLGQSLHDTGQIKPITGQVINEDGRDIFHMLTGERRFWATAIKAVRDGYESEPYVLALIDNQPSLEKQIAENMAYKALTPVGKARAAARLVLEANGIYPQPGEDEISYFRKVGEVRLSDETREKLQRLLQLERTYFGRLMKFLELDETLLEICDRSEMPERVFREITQYSRRMWGSAIRYYAEHTGRTYQDVHAFLERQLGHEKTRAPRLPADPATKSAKALRRVLRTVEDLPQEDKFGALADALVGDVDKAEAVVLVRRMEQLTGVLKQRLESLK